MSHIWVSHVTRINASCHTYEWVTSHIWMSHVTRMSESCHTYKCVISHVWMSDAMYINTSHVTCGWVMSHIWMRVGERMKEGGRNSESCHNMNTLTYSYETVRYVTHTNSPLYFATHSTLWSICVPRLTVTYGYIDSFICVTWLIFPNWPTLFRLGISDLQKQGSFVTHTCIDGKRAVEGKGSHITNMNKSTCSYVWCDSRFFFRIRDSQK